MKLLRYASVGTVIVLTVACSSLDDRAKPEGDFDYVEEQQDKKLNVPEPLNQPKRGREYQITNKPGLGAVGEAVDVRAPRLVLPVLTGTHLEEGSKEAKLQFDQIDDSKPLDQSIWQAVQGFLAKENIAIESKSDTSLITGWVDLSEVSEFNEERVEIEDDGWFSGWFSSENDTQQPNSGQQKFEFLLDVKPHGRTAMLQVNMLAEQDNQADISQRNLESTMLNSVIIHYDYQVRLENEKRKQKIREGVDMRLGFDNNGDSAYIVNADFERTWSRLPLLFKEHGFKIDDLDKSAAVYYVTYNGVDSGWFGLGGDDKLSELGLEKDDYQFQLGDLGETTSIVILNEDGERIPNSVLTGIFETLAESMASDSLD